MKFTADISDAVALEQLGDRVALYRLSGNLSQAALAEEAGVSRRTVVRLEQGDSIQATNLIRILRALRLLGNLEALIPEQAISPVRQLKLQGKSRKRASPQPEKTKNNKQWSWEDDE